MDWMLMPLQRYAEFSGRSRRKEFWMFQLMVWIVYLLCAMLGVVGYTAPVDGGEVTFDNFGLMTWIGGTIAVFFLIGTIIPQLSVTVRRFHDCNMSGWAYFGLIVLSFIPIIGGLFSIASFIITLVPGTRGPNKYGPSPLDDDLGQVFA